MTNPDLDTVAALLGRKPQGVFSVVVRDLNGAPVVIHNQPLLDDKTPMPTSYWLLPGEIHHRVSQLESAGGVNQAEAEIGLAKIAAAHTKYQQERDATISPDHKGVRPSGGVGGTRIGVKCLHAHLAWWLAGGDDPVGNWVSEKLQISRPVNGVLQ